MFQEAGFRCCTKEQFSGWWGMAVRVQGPLSAWTFCSDCPLEARRLMAGLGLCVREKKAAVAA